MGFLTEPIEDTVQVGRKKYRVNAAFNVILDVQRLYREDLPDVVKLRQALKMFGIRGTALIDPQVRAGLLEGIYQQCIRIQQRPAAQKGPPILDFEEDGEYIYASFMLDYGIDLVDMQGRLHWKKFIALFQGLSDRTKIREVMRIRGMELPKYTGQNQKQIQEITRLKSYYALPVRGGGGQSGMDALFSALEAQAVKHG